MATTAEAFRGRRPAEAQFRTCPYTGLKIHIAAQTLIKANAVAAVIFLAIGGTFGLLVALTRWPAVHLLPAEWFYLILTAHGLDVLLVWIIFFEVAVLYFASAILLNSRLATPWLAWGAFALMLIGALITNVAVLQGDSSVMFTSYPPMQAAPNFYLGLILFAVGALLAVFIFFGTLVIAKEEGTYEGSIPLVTFGALTAAIIAVFTIASGAIILIPTWLWSLGLISYIDPLMYKLVWWGMGHSSQQINVSAHVAVWYAIAALVLGAKPLSEKVSRTAFLLYILFLQLASAHHLLVEPAISSEWKVFNTSYAMYLAVLGSLIHGMTVPGAIEAAQRKKGFTHGIFEWLRKAPWDNPAFAGMFLSLVMFGFLGGISGVVLGTEQINLIMHNTLYVPGPLPRHRGRRHHARLHGAHLPGDPADLPARAGAAEARPLAALSVRHRRRRDFAVHDGCRHARRGPPALGHHLLRGDLHLRLSGDGVPDDGSERRRRAPRGDRWRRVHRRGGRLDPLRQEDDRDVDQGIGLMRRAAPKSPRVTAATAPGICRAPMSWSPCSSPPSCSTTSSTGSTCPRSGRWAEPMAPIPQP